MTRSQDEELRGIIRSLLFETKSIFGNDWPDTFVDTDGKTYSNPNGDSSNREVVYTAADGTKKRFPESPGPSAVPGYKAPKGAKPAPTAPAAGKGRTTIKQLRGDDGLDFTKLNKTLLSYAKSNDLTISSGLYNTVTTAADPAVTMNANIKIANPATVAYLGAVCRDLKSRVDKIKDKPEDLSSAITRFWNRAAVQKQENTLEKIYNESGWSQLPENVVIASNAGNAGVQSVLSPYLGALNIAGIGQTPDGFAKYISSLSSAVQAPGADAVAVTSGSAPAPEAGTPGSMGDLAALKTFLSGKDSITGVKASIDDKNVYTALTAFVKAVKAGQKNDRSFTGESGSTNEFIISVLAQIGDANKKELVDQWKGTKYMGQDFPGTSEGLVQFLKFAYIMRCENTAKEAATTMGYSQEVNNLVALNSGDTALTTARTIGALVPTAYIVIKGPGGNIPKGARLAITESANQGTTTAALAKGTTEGNIFVTEFISDYPNGLRLVLGKTKGDTDGNMTVDHGGPDAAAIVAAGLKEGGCNLTLKIGEDIYTLANQTYKLGTTIDFSTATATGPGLPGAGPAFNDLAGLPASGADVPGMSQEGPLQFSMRSIFPNKAGRLTTADLNATITKVVKRGLDKFTLQVTPRNTNPTSFFLIPVPLKRPLQEGAHWSLKLIDTGEKRPDVVLVPATKIEYNFKGNKINYSTTFENLQATVDAVFYNDKLTADDSLNVMTANDLLSNPKLGLTQADLDKAVTAYLVDDQNPIGGSMLRTASVHNAMNAYRRAAPITF